MDKVKAKHILGVALISLVVVIVYNAAKDKYNTSKTSAPATTTAPATTV